MMKTIIPYWLIGFVLISFLGCSEKIIKNSDYYKELKDDFNKEEQGAAKYKEALGVCQSDNDKLKEAYVSLSREVDSLQTIIDQSTQVKKSVEAPIPQTSSDGHYYCIESLHSKDANDNESLQVTYDNKHFFAYRMNDPTQIQLFWKDAKNNQIKNLANLKKVFSDAGKRLLFGMNAGIFKRDGSPEGLYIENGKEIIPVNDKEGYGNFFMRPNGIFLVEKNGKAQVLEREYFKTNRPDLEVLIATQSGPMLVVNDSIHPKFVRGSNNLNIRNGVGVDDEGRVVFLISEERINLHTFAGIFRDHFNCSNALYLDGAISKAYIPNLSREEMAGRFGPLIGVFKITPDE